MIPDNIATVVASMTIGAVICILAGIFIIIKRKKMPYEVWIPLLALSVLGAVGLLTVSLCLTAAFVVAT